MMRKSRTIHLLLSLFWSSRHDTRRMEMIGRRNSDSKRAVILFGTNWIQVGSTIDGEPIGDYFGYAIAMSSDGSILLFRASGVTNYSSTGNGFATTRTTRPKRDNDQSHWERKAEPSPTPVAQGTLRRNLRSPKGKVLTFIVSRKGFQSIVFAYLPGYLSSLRYYQVSISGFKIVFICIYSGKNKNGLQYYRARFEVLAKVTSLCNRVCIDQKAVLVRSSNFGNMLQRGTNVFQAWSFPTRTE